MLKMDQEATQKMTPLLIKQACERNYLIIKMFDNECLMEDGTLTSFVTSRIISRFKLF